MTLQEPDYPSRPLIESLIDLNEHELRTRIATLGEEERKILGQDVRRRSNELFSQFKTAGVVGMLGAEMNRHPAPYFAIPPPSPESNAIDRIERILDEEEKTRHDTPRND